MQRCGVRPAVGYRDADQNVVHVGLGIFDEHVEVAVLIEDAGVEWREDKVSFVKVATLRIAKQEFRTTERDELSEALTFSPAHALAEHRPIGAVNRARMRTTFEGNSPSEREPFRIVLFNPRHCLSGHPGEGLNASGRSHGLEWPALGTAARSASIWRGIARPGA